jgi:hypothetical protein
MKPDFAAAAAAEDDPLLLLLLAFGCHRSVIGAARLDAASVEDEERDDLLLYRSSDSAGRL